MRARSVVLLLALLVVCRPSRPIPVDSGVNFAAHAEHGRIVLDRLPSGSSGDVRAPGWLRWPGSSAPTFIVTEKAGTVAALWLTAPATVEVRAAASRTAPPVG